MRGFSLLRAIFVLFLFFLMLRFGAHEFGGISFMLTTFPYVAAAKIWKHVLFPAESDVLLRPKILHKLPLSAVLTERRLKSWGPWGKFVASMIQKNRPTLPDDDTHTCFASPTTRDNVARESSVFRNGWKRKRKVSNIKNEDRRNNSLLANSWNTLPGLDGLLHPMKFALGFIALSSPETIGSLTMLKCRRVQLQSREIINSYCDLSIILWPCLVV